MRKTLYVLAGSFYLSAALCAAAQTAKPAAPAATKAQLAHGAYIVGIGGCADCHSPLNEKGEPVPGQLLKGTKLFFGPLVKLPVWADTSPAIAGLPGWSTEDAIKLLTTGVDPGGQPPLPPMPQFKMNRTDAAAVVAYLKSLK